MTVENVQGLLGHHDIKTTMRYVHYVAEHAQEAAQAAEDRQLERLRIAEKQATNRQPTVAGVM